jgi:zinc transport system ATP-binding protein
VIGYVPQHLTTDSNAPATVEDMALAFSSSWPVFLPHRRRTVDKLRAHFARFEAAELLSHPVGRLSGGELQRVLLAIATLPKPDLLVLDEPVSGVDHTGLQTLYRMVEQLKQEDMVILMVTHDLAYVREHADRVLLLNKTVEACGTPQDVFATDAFRRAFPEGGWQHV